MEEAGRCSNTADGGCPRRSSLPTVTRSEEGDASALADFEHQLDQPRLTWAVDIGGEMRALTTFDLWYALNTGSLEASVKVWRLGREAWTPAGDIPELACALRVSAFSLSGAARPRNTLDYAVSPPTFGAPDDVAVVRTPPPPVDRDAELLSPDWPPSTSPTLLGLEASQPELAMPSLPGSLFAPEPSSSPEPASPERTSSSPSDEASLDRPSLVPFQHAVVTPPSRPKRKPRRMPLALSFAAVAAFAAGFTVAASAATDADELTPAAVLVAKTDLFKEPLREALAAVDRPDPQPADPIVADPLVTEKIGADATSLDAASKHETTTDEPSTATAKKAKSRVKSAKPATKPSKLSAKAGRKKTWSPTHRGQRRARQTSR